MHWTAVDPGVTSWPYSREPDVTNGPVTTIGMSGYTPVQITGIFAQITIIFLIT